MITSFRGEYAFLSNFYPCYVEYEGIVYNTLENAYQAAKSLDFDTRYMISQMSPAESKKFWKHRQQLIRSDWNEVKLGVMRKLLRNKFKDSELAGKLLNTYPHVLIEFNTWGDVYWGMIHKDGHLVGNNKLGLLLSDIREELYNE